MHIGILPQVERQQVETARTRDADQGLERRPDHPPAAIGRQRITHDPQVTQEGGTAFIGRRGGIAGTAAHRLPQRFRPCTRQALLDIGDGATIRLIDTMNIGIE